MKKRFIVAILSIALAIGAVGCSQAPLEPAKNNNVTDTASEEPSYEKKTFMEAFSEETSSEASSGTTSGGFTSGEINDNSYENSFFNVKFALNENYKFATDEELEKINSSLADMDVMKDNAKAQEAIDEGAIMTVAHASNSIARSTFNVTIQSVGSIAGALVDESTVLEQGKDGAIRALEAQGYTDVSAEIEDFTFLNEEHPSIVMKGTINGLEFHERSVCLMKDGYISLYSILGIDAGRVDDTLAGAEKLN